MGLGLFFWGRFSFFFLLRKPPLPLYFLKGLMHFRGFSYEKPYFPLYFHRKALCLVGFRWKEGKKERKEGRKKERKKTRKEGRKKGRKEESKKGRKEGSKEVQSPRELGGDAGCTLGYEVGSVSVERPYSALDLDTAFIAVHASVWRECHCSPESGLPRFLQGPCSCFVPTLPPGDDCSATSAGC